MFFFLLAVKKFLCDINEMENENKSYSYFVTALNHLIVDRYDGKYGHIAVETGLSKGYVNDIVSGYKTAGYKAQTKIANFFNMELTQFLLLGQTIEDGTNKPSMADFTYITKVKARPAAGNGSFETDSDLDGLYSFRSDWIRKKGNPKNLVLMDVMGDSMQPYIMDGDTVMIDQSKTDLMPNKIYAVRVEGLIYLKYIDMEPGKFILRSHNSYYTPINIEIQFLNDSSFQILGRAVWWCHDEIV